MPLAARRGAVASAALSLVVIGGGPRGTGVIERIAANAGELYEDTPLDLHVGDQPAGRRPDMAARPVAAAVDELHGRGRHHVHRRDGGKRPRRRDRPWTPGRHHVRAGRVTPDADPAVLAEIHGLTGKRLPPPGGLLSAICAGPTSERAPPCRPASPSTNTAPPPSPSPARAAAASASGSRTAPTPSFADRSVDRRRHLDGRGGAQQAHLFSRRHALSTSRPTSPPTATSAPCAPGSPSSSGGSGSPSST
ncbi:FAD/NAD(P)-binding protein [Streptomyces californicus]